MTLRLCGACDSVTALVAGIYEPISELRSSGRVVYRLLSDEPQPSPNKGKLILDQNSLRDLVLRGMWMYYDSVYSEWRIISPLPVSFLSSSSFPSQFAAFLQPSQSTVTFAYLPCSQRQAARPELCDAARTGWMVSRKKSNLLSFFASEEKVAAPTLHLVALAPQTSQFIPSPSRVGVGAGSTASATSAALSDHLLALDPSTASPTVSKKRKGCEQAKQIIVTLRRVHEQMEQIEQIEEIEEIERVENFEKVEKITSGSHQGAQREFGDNNDSDEDDGDLGFPAFEESPTAAETDLSPAQQSAPLLRVVAATEEPFTSMTSPESTPEVIRQKTSRTSSSSKISKSAASTASVETEASFCTPPRNSKEASRRTLEGMSSQRKREQQQQQQRQLNSASKKDIDDQDIICKALIALEMAEENEKIEIKHASETTKRLLIESNSEQMAWWQAIFW